MEKKSVQVIKGDADTITISVASTTTHEAVLTGINTRSQIHVILSRNKYYQQLSSH